VELLTYVSQVAKRKDRFIERSQDLASEFSSVDSLEEEMMDQTEGFVYRLKTDRMRFSEFQRVVADSTITSALSGVMLGDSVKTGLTDSTFASTTKALPYLWKFYNDVEQAIRSGRIEKMSPEEATLPASLKSPSKYARTSTTELVNSDVYQDILDEMPTRLMSGDTTGKAIPATWEGVQERASRYLVTPIYGWYSFGEMDKKRRTGFKEMRRKIPRIDSKCCEDCLRYNSQGWVPMGTLPPPGQGCRCLDRCRCFIEYR